MICNFFYKKMYIRGDTVGIVIGFFDPDACVTSSWSTVCLLHGFVLMTLAEFLYANTHIWYV